MPNLALYTLLHFLGLERLKNKIQEKNDLSAQLSKYQSNKYLCKVQDTLHISVYHVLLHLYHSNANAHLCNILKISDECVSMIQSALYAAFVDAADKVIMKMHMGLLQDEKTCDMRTDTIS